MQSSLRDNTEGREVNRQCLAVREQRVMRTQQRIKYTEDRQVQVTREYANSHRNLTRAREEAQNDLSVVERDLQQRHPQLRFPSRSVAERTKSTQP